MRSLSVPEAELMCRMIEAVTGRPRPKNMSAKEAIGFMVPPETRANCIKLADAAMLYFVERFGVITASAAGVERISAN
jgi:hypothetical protein